MPPERGDPSEGVEIGFGADLAVVGVSTMGEVGVGAEDATDVSTGEPVNLGGAAAREVDDTTGYD